MVKGASPGVEMVTLRKVLPPAVDSSTVNVGAGCAALDSVEEPAGAGGSDCGCGVGVGREGGGGDGIGTDVAEASGEGSGGGVSTAFSYRRMAVEFRPSREASASLSITTALPSVGGWPSQKEGCWGGAGCSELQVIEYAALLYRGSGVWLEREKRL